MITNKTILALSGALILALAAAGCSGTTDNLTAPVGVSLAASALSKWEVVTIDDTFRLNATSAACGFDVFERDFGTLKHRTRVAPDGSIQLIDGAVRLDALYFAPSTGKSVLQHPGATGPFVETDFPDGSVTLSGSGEQNITIPGHGKIFASSGHFIIHIDPAGNVTSDVTHGRQDESHEALCPFLAP